MKGVFALFALRFIVNKEVRVSILSNIILLVEVLRRLVKLAFLLFSVPTIQKTSTVELNTISQRLESGLL